METQEDAFFELNDLITKTKYSRNTIMRYVQQGRFPRPIRVGRANRWSAVVIEEWFAEQRKLFNGAFKQQQKSRLPEWK